MIKNLAWFGICFIASLVILLFHPFICFPGIDHVIFVCLSVTTMIFGGKLVLDVYNNENFF